MTNLKLKLFAFVLLACGLATAQLSTPSVTLTGTAATSACATPSACARLTLYNSGSSATCGATITVSGTYSGTVNFEASGDGGNTFQAISGTPSAGGVGVSSTQGTGIWSFAVNGYTHIQARQTANSSGNPVVTVQASVSNCGPATTLVSGTAISPSAIGTNPLLVGNLTYPTLESAMLSPQCILNSNGCEILDSSPETLYYAPGVGSTSYTVHFTHGNTSAATGNWWFATPWAIGNDQLFGDYKSFVPTIVGGLNAFDGSSGTIFSACNGNTQCGGAYLPTVPPPPPKPTGLAGSSTGGSLNNATTYNITYVYITNAYNGADSKATDTLPAYSAGAQQAGYAIKDGTTNCGGSQCTQALTVACTLGASSVTWSLAGLAALTVDASGCYWRNIGRFTATTSWGSPGFTLMGPEASVTTSCGSNTCVITNTAPGAVGGYPTAAQTSAQTAYMGAMVTGFTQDGTGGSIATHIFRMEAAAGTLGNTQLFTSAGVDGDPGPASGATLALCTGSLSGSSGFTNGGQYCENSANAPTMWQDVGNTANANQTFANVVGYIPLISTTSGQEDAMTSYTCTGSFFVGWLQVCPLTSSVTIQNASSAWPHAPIVETTSPVMVMGLVQNDGNHTYNSGTRVQGLTINTNNVATEGLINANSQENSLAGQLTIHGGSEVMFLTWSPYAQNSMVEDLNLVNPQAGNYVWDVRIAPMLVDNRGGNALKLAQEITANAYSAAGYNNNATTRGAPATTANYTAAGLMQIGAASSKIQGVHFEQVQWGYYCNGQYKWATAATTPQFGGGLQIWYQTYPGGTAGESTAFSYSVASEVASCWLEGSDSISGKSNNIINTNASVYIGANNRQSNTHTYTGTSSWGQARQDTGYVQNLVWPGNQGINLLDGGISALGGPSAIESSCWIAKATVAGITAGQVVASDPANNNAVIVAPTTATAGQLVGVAELTVATGGTTIVCSSGTLNSGATNLTPPTVDSTGSCTRGQFVINGGTTAGKVTCTGTYTAGTILGVATNTAAANAQVNMVLTLR